MRVQYHPLAGREVMEAAEFYEGKESGLGAAFVDQFDQAIAMLLSDPLRWPVVEGSIRRVMLRRFPFGIYYRVVDQVIRVLTVKHHRRHPGYGLARTETWPSV